MGRAWGCFAFLCSRAIPAAGRKLLAFCQLSLQEECHPALAVMEPVPLLPPYLHRESVWCIGAVRACPIQTKHSQEVQQAGPGERDASSVRPAWQGPGGLCFGALQHFSSWKAPLKEGRSMAP